VDTNSILINPYMPSKHVQSIR